MTYTVDPDEAFGDAGRLDVVDQVMQMQAMLKAKQLAQKKQKQKQTQAPTHTNSSGAYTIKRGDTLSALANRFGMSVEDIARMNGIQDVNKIREGQILRLKEDDLDEYYKNRAAEIARTKQMTNAGFRLNDLGKIDPRQDAIEPTVSPFDFVGGLPSIYRLASEKIAGAGIQRAMGSVPRQAFDKVMTPSTVARTTPLDSISAEIAKDEMKRLAIREAAKRSAAQRRAPWQQYLQREAGNDDFFNAVPSFLRSIKPQ